MDRETLEYLRQLEEQLWHPRTRLDPAVMGQLLAKDFIEFGCAGRIYSRADILSSDPGQSFDAGPCAGDLRQHAAGPIS